MGFNPPVPQQDSNWEIRVALLLSLLLQVLLIFLGPMRKRSASPITHFTIWSCYLLADWVADLALGLLLNNMGNIGGGEGNSTSSFGLKRGGGMTSATGSSSDAGSGSPIIFAFWTPFLLLHLGGPDTITAYSLEDNELWLRHLLGLLFELFSAVVVIVCSVRGNRLILATTLMMVVGVIKYGERTYSLYRGSIKRFRSDAAGPPDPGPNYAKLMTVFDSNTKANLEVEIYIEKGEAEQAQKEMEKLEAAHLISAGGKELPAYEFFLIFQCLFVNLSMSLRNVRLSQALFLESAYPMRYSEAFDMIEMELNFVYDAMYTKSPVAHTRAGWALRCVCSGCIVSALVIFFHHDKGGIARVDVGITYALLLGAVALDVVALIMLLFSDRAAVAFQTYRRRGRRQLRWLAWLTQAVSVTRRWWRPRRWSGTTSQFNLINHSLGKPAHACCCLCLNRVADWLGIDDIVDDFVFIRRVWINKRDDESKFYRWLGRIGRLVREKLIKPLVPRCCCKVGVHEEDDETEESHLLDFIFEGLKGSAQKLGQKKEIMEVCSRRGKGVVERLDMKIKKVLMNSEEVEQLAMDIIKKKALSNTDDIHKQVKAEVVEQQFNRIMDSVEKSDFDESLLLWHIATDLCRCRDRPSLPTDRPSLPTEDTVRFRAISKTLSEYMLYLLVKQPEMESARTGIWLMRYQDSCAEAQRFFGSMAAWNPEHDHDEARMMLLGVNTTRKPAEVKGDRCKSVLFDAVIVAKALRQLDESLMWEVVAGVWVEMLMYMASKCRGITHVRLLNRGGELITLVWFLMANMGLVDICQMQEGELMAKLVVSY